MADSNTIPHEIKVEPESKAAIGTKDGPVAWLDLLKVVAIPLVTLILGFVFNASLDSRQTRDSNVRLYTEMMGRREESDSALRKDMFNSILGSFMSKDPKLSADEQLEQVVLNLELLTYNFHESLDLAPLFKHVNTRIPDRQDVRYTAMRDRIEKVAHDVTERQLTVLSDSGAVETGDASLKTKYIVFGTKSVSDPRVKAGTGVSRVCLSMDSSDGVKHDRQFTLDIMNYDPLAREMQVRLYVSKVLAAGDCWRADLDLVGEKEIDQTFWVGMFDFPMIDNTYLTHSERCAVSLTRITPDVVRVALAYFPGSRASLKNKPYYDDLVHDLIEHPQSDTGVMH